MSMSVSLYFLGVGIYLLWIVGDKEVFEKYIVTKCPDIAEFMRNHTDMAL